MVQPKGKDKNQCFEKKKAENMTTYQWLAVNFLGENRL